MGRVLWVVVLVLFSLLFVRDVAAAVVEPGWSIVGVVALVATVAIGIIVDRGPQAEVPIPRARPQRPYVNRCPSPA